MKISDIHDHITMSYEVNIPEYGADYYSITLHAHGDGDDWESKVDIHFNGVIAHQFNGCSTSNVLFGIDESPIDDYLSNPKFEYYIGLPTRYGPSGEYDVVDAGKRLRELKIHIYKLESSCGIEGWVLAQGAECREIK